MAFFSILVHLHQSIRNETGQVSPFLGDVRGNVCRDVTWDHQNKCPWGGHGFGIHPITGLDLRLLREYVFSWGYKNQVGLVSQTSALVLFSSLIALTPHPTYHSITMGNTLAPMQQQLAATSTDSARDAKEILDRLEDMAQDRLDLFYEKIGCASSLLPSTTLA